MTDDRYDDELPPKEENDPFCTGGDDWASAPSDYHEPDQEEEIKDPEQDKEEPVVVDFDHPMVRELLGDLRLRNAVMDGELQLFAQILENYRFESQNSEYEKAIDFIRMRPHLFSTPLTQTPNTIRLSGCGVSVNGKKNLDEATGVYVKTRSITFFFIPLIPLWRFLAVTTGYGEEQGIGKIRLSGAQKNWLVISSAIALIFGLCIGTSILFSSFDTMNSSPVHVINGFEQPVEVMLDSETSIVVPPLDMKVVEVATGEQTFISRFQDGQEIEDISFEVPRRSDLVAYNVAGVGTAYLEDIVYFEESEFEEFDGEFIYVGDSENQGSFQLYLGQRRIVIDQVDHINEEPPEEIQLYGQEVTRSVFFYDGKNLAESTWQFYEQPNLDPLSRAFPTLVELTPDDYQLLIPVLNMAASTDFGEEWLEILAQATTENPDIIWLNIVHQRLQHDFGDPDASRRYYEELHDQEDTDLTAFYRLLFERDPDRRQELIKRAQQVETDDPVFHDELGFQFARQGLCDQAIPQFERTISSGVHEFGDDHFIPYARCLYATNQENEEEHRAQSELRDLIADINASPEYAVDYPLATFYARLTHTLNPPASRTASDTEFHVFFGLSSAPAPTEKAYLLNNMGIYLDDEYQRSQEEYFSEYAYKVLEYNEKLSRGAFEEMLDLYRKDFEELMYGGYDMILQRDSRVMLAFLALVTEQNDIFDELVWRARHKIDTNLHYSGLQPAIYILDEIDVSAGADAFAGQAPMHWDPEYRAAFYLAQAVSTEDTEDRRRALERVTEADPFWGPIHTVAHALLEEM